MIAALSTKQQFALSKFLNSLNEEWDIPGIEAALGRAREMAPGPELACAAIRASVTVGNRTPAVIALPGPHWRPGVATVRMPNVPSGTRCTVCSHPESMCRALFDDSDHKFMSVTEAIRRGLDVETKAAVAAEIRQTMRARQQHDRHDDTQEEA
jgi:hypothetical protein